jgi:poly-gamma-glutamate synthesis protein (capsule biosynthesis protein)
MDEQEYNEQLAQQQKERRARREAARRRHERRRRIFYGSIILVVLLIILIICKACGSGNSSDQEATAQTSETPSLTIENTVAPSLTITTPEVTTSTANLVFVGDVMCYQNQIDEADMGSGYDFASSFAQVKDYISAADLAVANLELNFLGGPDYTGMPTFNAPEALAADLAATGFDIMQTANTYSIINGMNGLESTINYVRAAGMETVGTYATQDDADNNGVLVKTVNGIKIAFIAFTKGVNGMDLPSGSEFAVDLLYTDYNSAYSDVDTSAIRNKVSAAKATDADVIIALLHWGSEYEVCDTDSRSSSQEEIEDLLFTEGVDAIIGTHPHVVGGLERKTVTTSDGTEKEVFVAYSLGNFFSSMTTDDTQASMLLNLEITKDSTGEVSLGEISYVPLYLDNENGYVQVTDIHQALSDASLDEDTADTLEDALATIHANAGITYDIENISETPEPTATAGPADDSDADAEDDEAAETDDETVDDEDADDSSDAEAA